MKKWEYKIIDDKEEANSNILKELGLLGWELCVINNGVLSRNHMIFKRQLEEEIETNN